MTKIVTSRESRLSPSSKIRAQCFGAEARHCCGQPEAVEWCFEALTGSPKVLKSHL